MRHVLYRIITIIDIVLAPGVDCGILTNPTNGQVMTPSGTTFNNLATYSCDTGYGLSGSATRVCGSDGLWTPDAPTCLC